MASPSLAILRVQSDERLVALARAGHERAFEAIVERYRRPLLRHARRLVGEARAEDAVQQSLLAAWAALGRGDDVRELGAWLHRIVRNTGLNALRGQREYAELRESFRDGGAPHDVLERRLVVRETLETLAALPERQREALLRTAIEGRSQAEVAESLGLSDGAVRQLVHRARTAMRAAATALTPLPAATWLASAGTRSEPIAGRVAELVAGSAGAGATLAKAGTIAVLAGGAATGPALVDRHEAAAPSAAKAERVDRAPARDRAEPARVPAVAPAAIATPAGCGDAESSGPGPSRDDSRDSSGPGSGGSSGSSGSGSGSSGSGSSGPSDSSGSGSSGSGSFDSVDSSGPSDSSGPGSSGSSSGSGSSGSADSSISSDSSGSGSSGSGSSGSGSPDSSIASDSSGSSGSGSLDSSGSSGSGSSGSG